MKGDNLQHFAFSYLVGYAFFLAITLGALVFIPIQYVTKASWCIVIRRLVETMSAVMPVMLVLGLPVFLLYGRLYGWANPDATTATLMSPQGDLLEPDVVHGALGDLLRAVWTVMGWFFWRNSLRQDQSGDLKLTGKMENMAGFAILVYALTIAMAGFDLIMSVDPLWFSTMFGVYYWAGGFVSFYAVLTLVTMGLQNSGRLTHIVSAEHFHDYGKLMFAFTFFWAYIAFSQYMLYWYANIPEETHWYWIRSQGGWGKMGLSTVFVTFALPFAGLVSRYAKRNRKILAFWAFWIIVAQWISLYWTIMPQYSESFVIDPMDLTAFVGVGGIWLAAVARMATGRSLVPLKDPRLDDSLRFENA